LRRLEHAAGSHPAHPYAVLWPHGAAEAEVKEASAALDRWLAPSGQRLLGSVEQTSFLADANGAVRAADLALASVAEGDLARAESLALVAIPGLAGFEPRAALRSLAAEMAALGLGGRPLHLLRLDLPPGLAVHVPRPARLAAALDDPAAQTALGASARPLGAEGRLLLVPPVLGLARTDRVRDVLRDATGCRVAELVGTPTLALAGFRLERALAAALDGAAVAVRRARALGVEEYHGRATALRVEALDGGEPIAAIELDALVLATGRFVGGGLVDRGGRLAEPILGLPLHDLGGRRVDGVSPHRLARRDYEGEQPLFASGVRTDARLRPLGAEGTPRLANLFAAGDLLGGFDPARERTGLGVALLTGRRAGAEAARC
jgi:glycerol-3-phosphate dehydrogenase subunit B